MVGVEIAMLELAGVGLGVLGAYYLILRRFADIVQPSRLRLAYLGETILASRPSDSRAGQIGFYLDNAFSGWVMASAAVLLPLAAVLGVAKYATGRFALTPPPDRDDDRLMLLFAVSAFAANPIFGLIVAAELLVIGFVVLVFSGPPALAAAIREFVRVETAIHGRRDRAELPALI